MKKQNFNMYFIFWFFYLMFFQHFNCNTTNIDPYKLFGLTKYASDFEIETSYKALKNDWLLAEDRNHPEAKYNLEKIEWAFQLLTDPEKKSQHDVFGSIEFNNVTTISSKFRIGDAPYTAEIENNVIQINIEIYENVIKRRSYKELFIICAMSGEHSHYCLPSLHWNQLLSNFNKHGIKLCTLHGDMEGKLVRRLGISSYPSLLAIMNGKITHYNGDILSIGDIMGFVYNLFPLALSLEIRNITFIEDLSSNIFSNKVSFVLFTSALHVPLSYFAAAFYSESFINFKYANISRLENFVLFNKYNISTNADTLLVFKENLSHPSFKFSSEYVSRWALDKIMKQHYLLVLPRISSQNLFNEICPSGSKKEYKRLCVILLANKSSQFKPHIESMREYADRHTDTDRVKFAYLYEDTQKYFVQLITWETGVFNATLNGLKVVIIWRTDEKTLSYDFLEEAWYAGGVSLLRARRKLTQLVGWSLTNSNALQNYAVLKSEIVDEFAKNIWIRILYRLNHWFCSTYDHYLSLEEGTCLMVFSSMLVIIFVGMAIKMMISREQNYLQCMGKQSCPNKKSAERPTVYIYPLCPENYNQLVTELEPTVRLILLLVDEPSKANLLQHFASAIVQYSKSKAFRFGLLQLEHYLLWYRRLLESTIQFTDESLNLDVDKYLSRINARNCLGTVLAINGAKKYYFMYHISVQLRQNENPKDDSDSEKENGMKLFESDLLRGLPIWLEKLCQGKLKKFKVSDWPQSMVAELLEQVN